MSARARTRSAGPKLRDRGFSLVEVMIALVVLSIGLLGIAKIQALAYASTGTASVRSLAAIEAGSLASAMRANRAYWSVFAPANAGITVVGTTVSSPDATFNGLLAATQDCSATGTAPCSATVQAAFDLQQWALALSQILPNAGATVACENLTLPVDCTVTVTWNEKAVAINKQGVVTVSAANTLNGQQSYTLYVEP